MSKKLTVVQSDIAPATSKLPSFKAYNDLADTLDALAYRYKILEGHVEIFEKHPTGIKRSYDHLPWIEENLAEFDKGAAKRIAEANAQSDAFNIEILRDEDGLKKSWIAAKVGELVGSFPQANVANPEIYVPMLINEIMAEGCHDMVILEMTVRSLRQSSKFIPSISEVLKELRKVSDEWGQRYDALEYIEGQADELRQLIAEAKLLRQQEEERRAAEKPKQEEQRQAALLADEQRLAREAERKLPIKVGDRVFDSTWGSTGTVAEIVSAGGDFLIDMCCIYLDAPFLFYDDDNHDPRTTIAPLDDLQKLIKGDRGFEPDGTKENRKL
ncbi:hypothetical protein FNL55_15465 [Tardiphaga sp. vice352]|uniref:hypothetical protein n=1 Tax=unclassified Tardiphaga TaxID=2631404 RepID=UPI001161F4C0|nr:MULTISPECIES: hypothetical protein [unclassified Tardiphaga]QDM17232.1 hypothetical protein FNL53_15755 [Tardiphaga sp. vice278]QDM22212.1 hypothetical protein FIU28_14400 [Tardiphaga sp. vice154]QDM32594.1 hypothetical protein FNL55_15465 [Tardiphaga sp. vice352]